MFKYLIVWVVFINMREINVKTIEDVIRDMCIESNSRLPDDLKCCIESSKKNEIEKLPRSIMTNLINNLKAAKELKIPVCQDTGLVVVFADVGQEVHFSGGNFETAINKGVSRGYIEGKLRCSIVADPLRRINTGDNTPAVIHIRIVDGDRVCLTVAPKGFGSENMSKIKMFNPSASKEDIIEFVLHTTRTAGSNPCPPIVLGIGIGGDFEHCALLAKKALCRPVSYKNEDRFYNEMEREILERINLLNIGPQGFGGKTTALSVAIEAAPTHIAGLPVAVNVGCHVTRHVSVLI